MVADFVPVLSGVTMGRTTLTTDFTVAGTGVDTPLPAPSTTNTVDGYTVHLSDNLSSSTESPLSFTVVDGASQPVVLEPNLDAFGHLVAFAKPDLAYTHIHPSSADETKGNGGVPWAGCRARLAPALHAVLRRCSDSHGRVHDRRHVEERLGGGGRFGRPQDGFGYPVGVGDHTPAGYIAVVDRTPGYHDTKDDVLKRLRRIEGQVRGLQRMVEEDTYCIDVLTQVSAATKALQSVAVGLLDEHLRHCVAGAVAVGGDEADRLVTEASRAIERLVKS
jgi:CsoR family transcriptional regulator, copper-sensing transcriptional repressor